MTKTKKYLKEFTGEVGPMAQMLLSGYLPIEFGVDVKKEINLFGMELNGFLGKLDVDAKGLYVEYERQ